MCVLVLFISVHMVTLWGIALLSGEKPFVAAIIKAFGSGSRVGFGHLTVKGL